MAIPSLITSVKTLFMRRAFLPIKLFDQESFYFKRKFLVQSTSPTKISSRCLVPECGGVYYAHLPTKEDLWDKYYMGAPARQRQFVDQS
ncbi:MAG: hypothetical protein AAGI90_05495, partial [Chlamydiota bacterium]